MCSTKRQVRHRQNWRRRAGLFLSISIFQTPFELWFWFSRLRMRDERVLGFQLSSQSCGPVSACWLSQLAHLHAWTVWKQSSLRSSIFFFLENIFFQFSFLLIWRLNVSQAFEFTESQPKNQLLHVVIGGSYLGFNHAICIYSMVLITLRLRVIRRTCTSQVTLKFQSYHHRLWKVCFLILTKANFVMYLVVRNHPIWSSNSKFYPLF